MDLDDDELKATRDFYNSDKSMSEDEIIKYANNIINATFIEATLQDKDGDIIEQGFVNKDAIQGLLDLYQKEKEKNKELESLLRLNKRKKKNNTTEYSKLNKLNKFGHNGICQDMRALKRKGITKYRAYITFQGKQYTLGSHDTLESAIKARKEAEKTIKKLLEENNEM